MNEKNRIEWIDCCKGFAIMLVVIGHLADGYLNAGLYAEHTDFMNRIYNTIYSFHMPLFFILSGFTFHIAYLKNRSEKRKKFQLQIVNNIYIYIYYGIVYNGYLK